MHIDSVRILHVAQPLAEPQAFGDVRLERHESVWVELRSGADAAWGQADPGTAPSESGQWAAATFACLERWVVPALVGQDLASGAALQQRLAHLAGNSTAKAAVDIAWWNLEARRQNVSLAQLLGARETVTSAVTSVGMAVGMAVADRPSIEVLDELLGDVACALEAGYQSVGLPFRPGRGVELVRAARARFPNARLWIDCEGLCSLDQRETFFRLDDFFLERIQQPLAADDLVAHAMLQESLRTPIALDQSVTALAPVEQAADLGSCRQVRVEPQRVGGITPALAIAAGARAAGLKVLAGTCRSPAALPVAQALAASAAFESHVDVGFSSAMGLDAQPAEIAAFDLSQPLAASIPGPNLQILAHFVLP